MVTPIEPIGGNSYPSAVVSPNVLKGKPGITVFSNPPFDPRILAVGGANRAVNPSLSQDFNSQGKSLHRGMLVTGAGVNKNDTTNVQYRVNFLYNPSTISESRTLDLNNQALPQIARKQDDPGQYATGMNAAVSFSLLFDRTYELHDSQYQGTIQGIYGVRSDVEAFFNLCGINQPTPQTTLLGGTNNSYIIQGPMKINDAMLYFGTNSRGALSYYGYINELDITYTHFSAKMVPSRCAVDVTFVLLPNYNYSISVS